MAGDKTHDGVPGIWKQEIQMFPKRRFGGRYAKSHLNPGSGCGEKHPFTAIRLMVRAPGQHHH